MNAYLLQIAEKYLRFFFLGVAIFALLRGHNYPGGGFIAGLLAALSVVYRGLAFDWKYARKRTLLAPDKYLALGLLFIVMSFLPSLITSKPVMEAFWVKIPLPFDILLKIGTPLIFDIGIFFVVLGVTIVFLFSQKSQN
jgi:multicomponent Na+:H+ antiporter subunit B